MVKHPTQIFVIGTGFIIIERKKKLLKAVGPKQMEENHSNVNEVLYVPITITGLDHRRQWPTCQLDSFVCFSFESGHLLLHESFSMAVIIISIFRGRTRGACVGISLWVILMLKRQRKSKLKKNTMVTVDNKEKKERGSREGFLFATGSILYIKL